MGMEFEVSSLEEMCDLMCDNKIPKPKKKEPQYWIFTFGYGQKHEGYYVKVKGTYGEARKKMVEEYGNKWGFQYSEVEWNKYEKQKKEGTLGYPLEKYLKTIE